MQNFSPSANNKKGYVGLIQFSSGAAASLGTSQRDLKQMTFVEQMDYVEKYLSKKKDKLNSMTDMYLQVLKPNAVGNGNNPDYVIFDESIPLPDGDGKNTSAAQRELNIQRDPWVKKLGYKSNPYFMVEEGEKKKREKWNYSNQKMELKEGFHGGKTSVWEVEQVLTNNHYLKGQANKFYGKCVDFLLNEIDALGRAPWMKIAILEGQMVRGKQEHESPTYEMAKSYLKFVNNNFPPTDDYNGSWCAAFLNGCIGNTENTKTGKSYEHAKSAASLAPLDNKLKKNYREISEPIFGCLIVYKHIKKWKGHTGFVYGKTPNDEYIILGGNQDDTIRFDTYGKYTSSSKKKKLYGFFIPKDYEVGVSDKISNKDIYDDHKQLNKDVFGILDENSESNTN